MPAAYKKCIAKLTKTKGKESAYKICTAKFIEDYGMTPKEWDKKHSKGVAMFDSTAGKWVFYEPITAHINRDGDYIGVLLHKPENFNSFKIEWLDRGKGIKAIIGLTSARIRKIQSILFDKNNWNIKESIAWKKKHFPPSAMVDVECVAASVRDELSCVSVLKEIEAEEPLVIKAEANKIELVTAASIVSLDELAEAGLSPAIEQIEKDMAEAGISVKDKDLMYLSFKLAHVGVNANKDEFLTEQLIAAEQTPVHKLVNWQHQEPNIGCMYASKHVEGSGFEEAHIHVASAISKMKYPAFADELIERFENKKLFASMETWFEKAKCSICGGEFKSKHDYCEHLEQRMSAASPCSRQLIGLTFAGAAVAVDMPADREAAITDIDD